MDAAVLKVPTLDSGSSITRALLEMQILNQGLWRWGPVICA